MTDLEVYQPPAPVAVPANGHNDFDSWIAVAAQVIKLAHEICDTPFVPDGLRGSAPAVAAAILSGRELRLPPITALQHTHVIKGKIGHTALLMRALIMAEGHDWQDVDVSDVRAVVKGRRKGEAEWAEASFTADQARRAHIDLGGYPQDKLYARATVRLARRKFADVILGMPYASEELEDGEVPGDVPAPADGQNGNGQEPPKPAARTARRRTAAAGDDTRSRSRSADGAQDGTAGDRTARDATPRAAGAAPSRGAQPLPPLPGEDEPETASDEVAKQEAAPPEQPEREPGQQPDRHRKLVGVVRAHFKRLGYTGDEDSLRLQHTAVLAGTSELGSTNDLDEDELKAVIGTLARCRNIDALKALLDAAQKAAEGDG